MADKDFVVKNGIVVNTAFSANSSGLYFSNTLTLNTSTFVGTSNNTSFVGSVPASNIVSNAQLSANISGLSSVYQTMSGLSANVVTLSANNTTFVNGKTEGNLNVNSATYATSAGSATNASAATNATYATSAGSAGSATNATYATSAGSATNASAATTFSSTSQNSQFNSLGVGTAASTTTGTIRTTGDITLGFSDVRLKTNIKVIENALSKISKISGITFNSNEIAFKYGYYDKSEQVGVIAQEIKEILPQIVKLAPFDSEYVEGIEKTKSGEYYLTVQYEKLVPLLIEAIKELSIRVEKIEDKL